MEIPYSSVDRGLIVYGLRPSFDSFDPRCAGNFFVCRTGMGLDIYACVCHGKYAMVTMSIIRSAWMRMWGVGFGPFYT